jgi:hypothetical protein
MPEWNPVPRALKFPALLFAITALFYWRITLTNQYDWMWSPDLAGQVLPWFQTQALQWHRHGFPMWDQYLWNGQPLFGQAQPGAAYPLNWLLFWLPFDDAGHIRSEALTWYFVCIHFMAAAFAYRLCRDLGRSSTASLCAAMIFTFGGYIGGTDWPQMVNGAVWIPLVFMYLLRAGAGKRPLVNGALAGAFLGAAWLSGHHQVVMFTSLACAGTWIFLTFRKGRINWSMVRSAAAWLVFTGLVGAMQILPALEYGRLAKRWVGAADSITWDQPVPYYVHEKYSLSPPSVFGIVFAGAREGVDPFVGIVALTFAALAVAACWRRDWRVPLLAAVGAGGLVYALGGLSVFQGALYGLMPSLDKARAPSVATALFGFAVAALAAYGVDAWLESEPSPWTRKVAYGVAGFGVVTGCACLAALLINKLAWQGDTRPPLVIFTSLALSLLLLAVAAGNITRATAGALGALLLVFDLYQGCTSNAAFAARDDKNRDHYVTDLTGNTDIANFLHGRKGIQRTEVPNEAFLPNWGAYHDVPMHGGYLASVSANMMAFEFFTTNARKLWGVAYQIAAKPTDYASQEIFSGASGMKLFLQPDAFPRAWATHDLTRIQSQNQLNWYVANRLDLLRSQALMFDAPPSLAPCPKAEDNVQLVEDQGSRVGVKAQLNCPAMIVVSDVYYPGWRAWVDGKPAPIYAVNGAMRGVMVPAGVHSVTMRYRPASVFLGAALTLTGILGAILLVRNKRL